MKQKPCECRKCGDSFSSIAEGILHIRLKHDILFYADARGQLIVMCFESGQEQEGNGDE